MDRKRTLGIVLALAANGCTFGLPDDPFDLDRTSTTEDRDTTGELDLAPRSGAEPAYEPPEDTARADDDWSYRRIELENAAMAGQIGTIQGFDAPATDAFAEEYGSTTSIELHIENPEMGWVMTSLDLGAIPGEEPLVVGSSVELTSAVYREEDDAVQGGLGCSGPTRDEFEYDEPVTHVVLEVVESPNPGYVRLVFESEFETGYEGGEHFVQAEADYPLAL